MLTQTLSTYALEFELARLSEGDQAHLEDALVNWVGCAIGGARAETVDAYARAASTWSSGGQHAVLGRDGRFALPDAIALDCLSSAVLAFDDTHLETVLHPTGPIAAALLGQARLHPMSGRDFLTALHVGMEIECRAGLAITAPEAGAKRGWYLTGITGGIGAAAAVGRVLGFDAAAMQHAMGMAAARAAGNRGTHGSMTAAYVPSLAAESGFAAAHLTKAGLLCGARALDGSNGLLELVTQRPAIERALDGLGAISEAARTAFKPFPAGIVAHPAIEACLTLAVEHGVTSDTLITLAFRISKTTNDLVANKFPQTVVQAQVSLFYWGALAIATGAAGVEQARADLINDPILRSLQGRMTSVVDPDLADDQCVATATLRDDTTIEVRIEHAIGSVVRPMTREQIDAKFFDLTRPAMPQDRAVKLHAACRGILALDDVTRLLTI